jgi:hypothetical protein
LFLFQPSDLPLTEQMDVDTIIEETTKGAAAGDDKVAVDEAAKVPQDETIKESAEEAGKEFGDHTDGIPAAGAPGATPATEPPAAEEGVVGN